MRVSIHGGHSGQFCNHAEDTLEDVIKTYIEKGFAWVGITEHMPPVKDLYLFPDEIEAGLNAASLYSRFASYISTCRGLQQKYQTQLRIYTGFETETYEGSMDLAENLIRTFKPDYIVGSVHHVGDIPFDYSREYYAAAVKRSGSIENLYKRYFDRQFEMIERLKPEVVGHFDLIRIFDPDYKKRVKQKEIHGKIQRNLKLIQKYGLIMDYNLRPLARGEQEAYPTKSILNAAVDMGIHAVPGDDSHGIGTAGLNVDRAIDMLNRAKMNTNWPKPMKGTQAELSQI